MRFLKSLPARTALLIVMRLATAALAQTEYTLQNYTETVTYNVCPCFISGEQAGAVLQAPPSHYPLEILRVGIFWTTQFGGTPQQLEQSIHIYGAGLPNPGSPIFSLDGPVLTDGFMNEFDLEPFPGELIIDSGPFTVTLEFLNENAGNIFAPSMVFDTNGCQAGKNVVYAIPGGWSDACALGVSGDWVVYAVYRQSVTGVGDEGVVASGPLPGVELHQNYPNPFNPTTAIRFDLAASQPVALSVFATDGSLVATLIDAPMAAGPHEVFWNGRDAAGRPQPSGVYYYRLDTGHQRETRSMVLLK